MTIIATLKDGRVIAYASKTQVVSAGTNVAITVPVPDLRNVEYVLEVNFKTDPDTTVYGPHDKKITGNVVGLTIAEVAAGTTLTTEIIAIGPP